MLYQQLLNSFHLKNRLNLSNVAIGGIPNLNDSLILVGNPAFEEMLLSSLIYDNTDNDLI